MSRRHARPPDADWLTIAQAIRRALDERSGRGETPVALVLNPDLWELFRTTSGGAWELHTPSLFALPVEMDSQAEGWAIRVK